jgi:hypothetical protein
LAGIEIPATAEPSLRIDAYSNSRKAALQKQKMSDIADSFAELKKAELIRVLPMMKLHTSDQYQYLHGKPMDGIFIGIESGSPMWIVIHFFEKSGTVMSEKHVCHLECGNGGIPLGVTQAIREAGQRNPQLGTGDPETVAASLVQIEIDGQPEDVGGPIAELRLDKTGAHWLQPGVCVNREK